MMVRFTFTYDDKFDKDIQDIIQKTPVKRRSEQLRQLIRYGLMYQSKLQTSGNAIGITESQSAQTMDHLPQVIQESSAPSIQSDSDRNINRALRFGPKS